jgi:hypothetical protein
MSMPKKGKNVFNIFIIERNIMKISCVHKLLLKKLRKIINLL